MTAADTREVLALAALSQGRTELSAGNLATAAEAFRIAQRDPSTMAEASNGLGVVYARIQRFDLAQRYFSMAASLEPENARFAANAGRVERDVMLARMDRERQAEAKQKAFAHSEQQISPASPASAPQTANAPKLVQTNEPRTLRIAMPDAKVEAPVSANVRQATQFEQNPSNPRETRIVTGSQLARTDSSSRTIRIMLPSAKPLAKGEYLGADGMLQRVSDAQSHVHIGKVSGGVPNFTVVPADKHIASR